MAMTTAQHIARSAGMLIKDPERHTVLSDAVDASDNSTFGGTDRAVAWSCLGAVNRVGVLEHNLDVEGWISVLRRLRAMGVTHETAHKESLDALRAIAKGD
jgi:hypothetical protein